MANAITGNIICNINLVNTYPATTGSLKENINVGQTALAIAAGTGANQMNELYSKTISLAATPTTLNLLSLTGIGGRTITFTAIKLLHIVNNDPTSGHSVAIGNAASTPWYAPFDDSTAIITLPGGASGATATSGGTPILLMNLTAAGWTVDSGHGLLMLDPASNTVSVTVTIGGLA